MAPKDNRKPFLATLPGILTGVAAIIAAITTLFVTVRNSSESLESKKPATSQNDSTTAKSNQPSIVQQNEGDSNIIQQSVGDENITIGQAGPVTVTKTTIPKKDSTNGNKKKKTN